jgi:hypothetical protein
MIITNSMALVRKQTIPTERKPLVSAYFLRADGVTWSARRIPTVVFSVFLAGAATISSK